MDGEVDLFSEKGLYDGLFLLSDERTGTYWNHLTGEALYGPLAGERLELENVLHTTVAQVLAEDPATLVAISDHPRAVQRSRQGGTLSGLLSRIRSLPGMFTGTIRKEDDRRETMEVGIGIWDDSGARYYSMGVIEANDRALFDTFAGRRVLLYFDPAARALMAHFTEAESARWEGDILHLSDGERIEDGIRFAEDGSRAEVERPLQVFTRWYGFSLTFPDTDVYKEAPPN